RTDIRTCREPEEPEILVDHESPNPRKDDKNHVESRGVNELPPPSEQRWTVRNLISVEEKAGDAETQHRVQPEPKAVGQCQRNPVLPDCGGDVSQVVFEGQFVKFGEE